MFIQPDILPNHRFGTGPNDCHVVGPDVRPTEVPAMYNIIEACHLEGAVKMRIRVLQKNPEKIGKGPLSWRRKE